MYDSLSAVEVIINRILIVEGNPDEAAFLKDFLNQNRFQTEVTRDFGQARSAFNLHQPDFVILEAILPNKVSGFEVCEYMKREKSSVPVLMLTEIDLDDARHLAARVGVDAYMTKPYDPNELVRMIRRVAESVWQHSHALRDNVSDGELIRFPCTGCGARLKARNSHRGRKLNCPRCHQGVMIPVH